MFKLYHKTIINKTLTTNMNIIPDKCPKKEKALNLINLKIKYSINTNMNHCFSIKPNL